MEAKLESWYLYTGWAFDGPMENFYAVCSNCRHLNGSIDSKPRYCRYCGAKFIAYPARNEFRKGNRSLDDEGYYIAEGR